MFGRLLVPGLLLTEAPSGRHSASELCRPSVFARRMAIRRGRAGRVHWHLGLFGSSLLPTVVVWQGSRDPDGDRRQSGLSIMVRGEGTQSIIQKRREAARGMWSVGPGGVPGRRHRAVDVLKDVEADVAAAEPVVEVAGGAERHSEERHVPGEMLKGCLRVGEATSLRALVAPSARGVPAFSAREHSCVRKRKVYLDVRTPS